MGESEQAKEPEAGSEPTAEGSSGSDRTAPARPVGQGPGFTAKYDLPAGIVVALVALPLCLGIALASGAPLLSGIIAGICGGLVAGALSGSSLAVSGPAAGLTVIVLRAIEDLGGFEVFLAAGLLAGALQLVLGVARAGVIGDYFPSAVIKGMLAAIGFILILKQIPHAFGWDADPEGDFRFWQPDGENTFSAIAHVGQHITLGAVIISVISLIVLIIWERPALKKVTFFRIVPGPLVAVLLGLGLSAGYRLLAPDLVLGAHHRVDLPVAGTPRELVDMLTFPDFAALARPDVWLVAVTIAIVASLETLLSIDAMDQLDPYHRITPKNRELLAQGTGNGVSSLLGGLPITAVIVRSTANLSAGATSRVSTIFHGALLLVSVAFAANLLNEIPLASLAAILIMVGFKLTRPSLYVDLFKKGYAQFIPFIITVLAILFTDLLTGIIVGMAVGLLFIVRSNFHRAVRVTKNENQYLIRLNQNVTFLNKAYLRQVFRHIPEGAYVIIDGSRTKFIDNDILETLENFEKLAELRGITVERKRTMDSANPHFRKMEAAA